MRPLLAALLAVGAAAGSIVYVAHARESSGSRHDAPARRPAAHVLPAPSAALPRDPAGVALALTATTRLLRAAVQRWGIADAVPRDVTFLALQHQRLLRLMAAHRALGDATLARLPSDVRGEARDTVFGQRDLAAITGSPGRAPRVRLAGAAPAADLRRFYSAAQRRFHVDWSILASINFVESAFGRVRSASKAGARGPMQFMPATWREYGMGADIENPRDAIMAAANYLRRAGAPGDLDGALFAYNHSMPYVRAIRHFAARMRADHRAFLSYYAWQVFVSTPAGARRLTGPGRD